jgi:hypothetical protein
VPLSVGSSNNLWARLTKGPATARFAQVQDPKGPRTAHLLHSRATSKPAAGLGTPSRRSDLLPSLRQPGSGQAGQPVSPGATRGRAAPHSSSCPKETGRRRAAAAAAAAASCVPSPPQRTPSGPTECLAGFVCAAALGVRRMRPGPRGRGQPGQPLLPTARRRPPSGAPCLRGSVAVRARVGEAARYLSLRSPGASSRAASASPPPLLRSHWASSCSRRRDRRAEPAAGACAGAPLRLASPAHPAWVLRPGPAHRGRGARGHPAWSCPRHSHLHSPISQKGRLTHLSAQKQSQPRDAPPCKADEVFRHCQSAAPTSVYPDSAALLKRRKGPSCPGLSLVLQVSGGCRREPGTSGERKRMLTSSQYPAHVLKWPFLKSVFP